MSAGSPRGRAPSRCRACEELRRVLPVVEGIVAGDRIAHPPAGLDRHVEGLGGARLYRGRRDAGQRRKCPARRPGDGGARRGERGGVLPDAHARRAAHDAGRPSLRRRRGRRAGVPGGADGLRRGRGRARGADHARPGDRVRQDARAQPCAAARAWRSSRRSGARWSWAPRARASSGASSPMPPAGPSRWWRAERLPGTIATNVLAYERGASVFRVHDVAPVRDALTVAAATLG